MEADPSTMSLPTDVQDHELLEPSATNTQQLTASDTITTQEDLTHKQAMEIVREGLSDVLDGDPLLSDLPAGVTSEEVALQIALEYGQAMTVCVQKFTGEIMRKINTSRIDHLHDSQSPELIMCTSIYNFLRGTHYRGGNA